MGQVGLEGGGNGGVWGGTPSNNPRDKVSLKDLSDEKK